MRLYVIFEDVSKLTDRVKTLETKKKGVNQSYKLLIEKERLI